MAIDRRSLLVGSTALAASGPVVARPKPRPSSTRFLWGVATAAHQIEGNNVNSDYWLLENIKPTYYKEPSLDACDSFNRWREDLALIQRAGLNCYRFSIEWARIEPEPGQFSTAMLEHYRRIGAACRDAGIEPVVTFHHFTSPRWLAARGGWEDVGTPESFARFCDRAGRALAGIVRHACTLNEPNAQVTSQVMGGGKPWAAGAAVRAAAAKAVGSDRFGAFFLGDAFRIRDVCLDAHRLGRDAIKAALPGCKVGLTLALQEIRPAPGGEDLYKKLWDNARLPFYEAARDDDFIGVQTYNRTLVGATDYIPVDGSSMVDSWNRDASPEALPATMAEAHKATGKPVFVTEHGINAVDDALRVRHMRAALPLMGEAVDRGLPLLGYVHWSLLDNFEWSSGYVPRFGLVAVDRRTFERTPKPSLFAYRDTIAQMRRRHAWA